MKLRIIVLLSVLFLFSAFKAQDNYEETMWDNGVPVIDDNHINDLIIKLSPDSLKSWDEIKDKKRAKICYEIGMAFNKKKMYEGAAWYLSKVKDYKPGQDEEVQVIQVKDSILGMDNKMSKITEEVNKSLNNLVKDQTFFKSLPKSYNNVSRDNMKNLLIIIENQINQLTRERDSLINAKSDELLIKTKETSITSLKKEKNIISLTIDKIDLNEQKAVYRRFLIGAVVGLVLLVLTVITLLQRKTIKAQDVEIEAQLRDIEKKNTFLEYAASIIRHDMHSGINTYMPRGLSSLEKRITDDQVKELKIESALKMIKEGLSHTQKVYKKVHEFTSLVKQGSVLEKNTFDLKDLITKHLDTTSFKDQVIVKDLIKKEVNDVLFCLAVENLIKNGLKFNNNNNKEVVIYMEDDSMVLQDNSAGLSEKDFEEMKSSYSTNISSAVLSEMGFTLNCEKNNVGNKMVVKLN